MTARLEWVPALDVYELTIDGRTYELSEAQVAAAHDELAVLLAGGAR